jgi:hypothetical protein
MNHENEMCDIKKAYIFMVSVTLCSINHASYIDAMSKILAKMQPRAHFIEQAMDTFYRTGHGHISVMTRGGTAGPLPSSASYTAPNHHRMSSPNHHWMSSKEQYPIIPHRWYVHSHQINGKQKYLDLLHRGLDCLRHEAPQALH